VPRDFETLVVHEHDAAVVWVKGEVDLATSMRLEECVIDLVNGGDADVVIDLTETAFIDASGLGALVKSLDRARSHGGDLKLRGLRPQAFKVLKVTGLVKVFTIERPLGAYGDR